MLHRLPRFIATPLLAGCAAAARPAGAPDPAALRDEVEATERAFARTMADRDHRAFTTFLSDEAVFFSGETPTRGREAVAAQWLPLFAEARAPFSWEPDRVEVLQSGTLALSTGPVRDPDGRVVGRFNSIWRREAPGRWRVFFDKGSPVCPPAPTPPQ
jgi:ketosteroid isomerase-like protein